MDADHLYMLWFPCVDVRRNITYAVMIFMNKNTRVLYAVTRTGMSNLETKKNSL